MGSASERPGSREASLPYSMSPPIAPEMDPAADLTRAMAERIEQVRPHSGSDALRELRAAFPDSPLALRVAALRMAMQGGTDAGLSYRPR